ncbi:MAG: hypothetical protein ABIQ74_03940 [Chitinophagales bacterium]
MKKILIGTVGYHNLRNHSIGPVLLPELKKLQWPQGVELDEMNWGPIAIVQKFQSLSAPYDRVVLLAAIERPNRTTGEFTVYRWMGGLPDEEMIQACIGDAVTGVISVENLLIIGEHFKIWPNEVFVIDVEPGPEQAGEEFTPEVKAIIPEVISYVREISFANDPGLIRFEEW